MDMYFKCGDIQEAKHIFDSIANKEMDVFLEMTKAGAHPNDVTMIGVLSACAHRGLIEEGRKWFRVMDDLRIECGINHYGCMEDLLRRRGHLEEAQRLVEEIPYSLDGIVLSSLLLACICYKDIERAERVMKKVERIEPGNVRNYVMQRRRWRDVERIKEVNRSSGGKKEAGCSVIEVGRRVWEFVSGNKLHSEWEMRLHVEFLGNCSCI